MLSVAILGSGGIGHALSALLGGRPELKVTLWGRRWREQEVRSFVCLNAGSICAVGRAIAEPDIQQAVRKAEIVIITVPTHARQKVLREIAEDLVACRLLLSWEGTGPFRESLREFEIDGPICAGLQRSPIVARVRCYGSSCDLLGVRSAIVAAAVEPDEASQLEALLAVLLPFRVVAAPSFEHVSLSPGNPLIHPARLFSIARMGAAGALDAAAGFYANWNNDASNVLLDLHRELVSVREALSLSERFITTLADRSERLRASQLSAEIRGELRLADVPVPGRTTRGRWTFDWDHRFFREDIGQGLSYILRLAKNAGVRMTTAEAVVEWYDSASARARR